MQPFLPALALLCFASFIWGAYFHFRTTDSGARTGQLIVSIMVGAAMAFCMITLATSAPTGNIAFIIAATCLLTSLCLFWLTVKSSRSKGLEFLGSTSNPSAIVANGTFRLVRHPFYLSYILAWIGTAVGSGSIAVALTAFILTAFYWESARREERKILASPHSLLYAKYREKTGMFIPKIASLRKNN